MEEKIIIYRFRVGKMTYQIELPKGSDVEKEIKLMLGETEFKLL